MNRLHIRDEITKEEKISVLPAYTKNEWQCIILPVAHFTQVCVFNGSGNWLTHTLTPTFKYNTFQYTNPKLPNMVSYFIN